MRTVRALIGTAAIAGGMALTSGIASAADVPICTTSCETQKVDVKSELLTTAPNDSAAQTQAAAPRSNTAPAGALPLTGGDVLGLVALGSAAIVTGTVLTRRARVKA